ncbi:MAG: sulfurtransferase TusA family protein [Candidatus Limnocylindrales bacterium]
MFASASPPPAEVGSTPPRSTAVASRVGAGFVDAIVRRDFDTLEALLAPEVRFRALTPRAVREAATASGARAWIEDWFGETDRNQLITSRVEMIADRLHLAYRIQLREGDAWYLVEQHLFGTLGDARLTDVALVCSGFRPIEVPTSSPQPRVDARLDATGKSCATLTPEVRAAVRLLEPGQVLEIVADDPTAEEGLRAWTRLTGNELVAMPTVPDTTGYFYLRRGAGSTSGTNLPGGKS